MRKILPSPTFTTPNQPLSVKITFLAPTGAQGVMMSVCVCDFLQKRTLEARPQAKAPWRGQGESSRESLSKSSRKS